MTSVTNYHAGFAAEDIVAQDYVRRNHGIAARRWRGTAGEIDLIARDGDQVVFIEVKKSRDFATAATRLGRRQMDRICASAMEFLAGEPKGQLTDVRFDLAMVNSVGALRVIENAFMEG
ncbi:MAG: YraN family protein [Yoonia sp.]|uniref:YraN family protein n=1 Tax=Yoonia sp. TaxID=2212373 RepID=UPI003EF2E627